MHVARSEASHDKCRSEKLIQIMNHLCLCISYDEVERSDNALVQHTIDMASSHPVPLPSSIVPHGLVHEAMGNFDHKENAVFGIGASHDTILMLFQNITDTELCNKQLQISKKDVSNELKGKVALEHIQIHVFLYKKTIFCLSLNFLNIMPEIRLRFLNFFLNFYLFIFF